MGIKKNGAALREPRFIKPFRLTEKSVEGLCLGKSAENFLSVFPASVNLEKVDALEFLEDISFLADLAG